MFLNEKIDLILGHFSPMVRDILLNILFKARILLIELPDSAEIAIEVFCVYVEVIPRLIGERLLYLQIAWILFDQFLHGVLMLDGLDHKKLLQVAGFLVGGQIQEVAVDKVKPDLRLHDFLIQA